MLEYGTITSVFNDDTLGGQLCHVKGNLTSAEYQNCEVLTPKGLSYIPKVGDTCIVVEMNNSEVVVLGTLEQFNLGLSEGEILLHGGTVNQGQSPTYDVKTMVKFNKDNEIIISTLDNGVSKATITIKPDGEISIVNLGKTSIQSSTGIELIAPTVNVI